MDLALDHDRAKAFDCETCDKALRFKRNCDGKYGRQGIMKVNNQVYFQCPRSIAIKNPTARRIIDVYFDCRDKQTWPYNGSILDQSKFCVDTFNYLDGLYVENEQREHKRLMDEMKKGKDGQ